MRKILIGLGVVVVVLVAAAFVVPMFIPTDTYKEEIASRVRDATGRELVIKGDIKFTILPTLGLTVKDVAFANAPGAATKQMATFKQLVVKLKMMPLISGDVEVDQFELIEPVINLEVDRKGQPNWVFKGKTKPAGKPAAKAKPAKPSSTAQTGKSGGSGSSLKLRDVRLVKGRVTYLDRRTGARQRIDDANLTVALTSMSSPLTIDGSLVWNRQQVTIKARVDNPQAVSEGKSSRTTLALRSQPITLTFGGVAKGGKAVVLAGQLNLDIPSIRKLAAWTGNPIKMAGAGLGPFKVKGALTFSPNRVVLTKADIRLDAIAAKGDLSVLTAGRVPTITAKLNVAKLDLNPYLAGSGAPASASGGATATGGKTAARPARSATKGWSRAPINTAPLRTLNADLDLSAGSILYQRIKVGRSRVRVRLNGGRLVANLLQLQLYGGSGTGKVVLDARGAVPKIAETFQLSGLNALPFLHDAAGYDGLSGKGSGSIAVTGSGRSQYDIVRSLNGAGKFDFRDGAIKGTNFVGMVCSFDPAAMMKGVGKDKETRFSRLAGIYTIKRGILSVAKYEDLRLKSPLLRLGVKGKTSLPARTLDFRIEPKIVGTCKGQSSAFAKKGVAVPLMLGGTWEKPRWKLDLAAVLKMDPKDLKKGAKDLKKGIKSLIKGKDGKKPGAGDLKKIFEGFGKKKE